MVAISETTCYRLTMPGIVLVRDNKAPAFVSSRNTLNCRKILHKYLKLVPYGEVRVIENRISKSL